MAASRKKGAKKSSRWVCTACGATTTGWFGKCPSCQGWNTIEEDIVAPEATDRVVLSAGGKASEVARSTEAAAASESLPRVRSEIDELDRVLGGGLVPGSVVLLGGPPGIGKSTLLLQACAGLAQHGPVLYASGEESVAQVASRARRLGAAHDELMLMAETRSEAILEAARENKPGCLVVDSVQTVYSGEHEGLPGNVSQIRAVAAQLISHAKSHDVPVMIVGHVTKDGQLAGPRLLEHMVDAVLSFEGDEERATRLLRATKNRFGSTQELGVFEMSGEGLREIANPSEAFLSERPEGAVGSCVTATLEGSRPLLLEVQALLGPSPGGSPRRTCVGAEQSRVAMLLAVLDRHAGLFVLDQDVFVNVAGGMRLTEPAADLATLLAIASSHRGQALAAGTAAVGEVGLTGELRRVPRLEARLTEAARLGFSRVLVPRMKKRPKVQGIELIEASTVGQAVSLAFED